MSADGWYVFDNEFTRRAAGIARDEVLTRARFEERYEAHRRRFQAGEESALREEVEHLQAEIERLTTRRDERIMRLFGFERERAWRAIDARAQREEAARRGRFYRDLYRKSGSETHWDLEDTDDEVREEEDLQRELEEFEAVWPTIGEES